MNSVAVTHTTLQTVEDGDREIHLVTANDADGREYTLARENLSRSQAARVVHRVREAGEINPDLWHCRVPYGTNAWLLDDMEWTLYDDEELYHKGYRI